MELFNIGKIGDVFGTIKSIPNTIVGNLPDGFARSNIDLLLEQARRFDSVRENRIFDFIGVEGDPWFSKRYEKNYHKILKSLSDLQTSSAIVNTVVAQLDAADILGIIPDQLKQVLLHYQQFTDTTINLLLNYNQQVLFSQITTALFGDLKFNLGNKTITLNDIFLFANRFYENFSTLPKKPNDIIRKILELQLINFLPKEFESIFEVARYADKLIAIFGAGAPEIELFKSLFKKNKKAIEEIYIADCIPVEQHNAIENYNIDINDILGVNVQSSIEQQVLEYTNTIILPQIIIQTLDEGNIILTDTQLESLIEATAYETSELITLAFDQNFALPELTDSVEAIRIETNNMVFAAHDLAFKKLSNEILVNAGVMPKENSFDELQNLKKNLASYKNTLTPKAYKYIEEL